MRKCEPEPGTNWGTLCHPLASKGIPEPVMNPSNPSSTRVPEHVMNPSAAMEKVREMTWKMVSKGITKGSKGIMNTHFASGKKDSQRAQTAHLA